MKGTGNWNTGDSNTGNWNTGNCNTGYWNTGNWNTGDSNTGNWNTGNWNTGDRNTGNRNTGDWNAGNRNAGNRNTGNWNTGNRNTGDWNTTNASSGIFNTEEQKILIFNKPSDITLKDWWNSDARYLLNRVKPGTEWIWDDDMTDEEKEQHPEYKVAQGYLKEFDLKESCAEWWGQLTQREKCVIQNIPNFDKDVFFEVTGIKIEE